MYDLVNRIKSPARNTHDTCSLIDVMITNLNLEKQNIIKDLGYSDHLAQTVYVRVDKPILGPTAIKKRQFTDNTVQEFIYLLEEESWDEDLLLVGVNIAFNAFVIMFMYYFNPVFPIKTSYLNNNSKNKWLTKGLTVSRNRTQFLNKLKRSANLSVEFLHYINKYQAIYKTL